MPSSAFNNMVSAIDPISLYKNVHFLFDKEKYTCTGTDKIYKKKKLGFEL